MTLLFEWDLEFFKWTSYIGICMSTYITDLVLLSSLFCVSFIIYNPFLKMFSKVDTLLNQITEPILRKCHFYSFKIKLGNLVMPRKNVRKIMKILISFLETLSPQYLFFWHFLQIYWVPLPSSPDHIQYTTGRKKFAFVHRKKKNVMSKSQFRSVCLEMECFVILWFPVISDDLTGQHHTDCIGTWSQYLSKIANSCNFAYDPIPGKHTHTYISRIV